MLLLLPTLVLGAAEKVEVSASGFAPTHGGAVAAALQRAVLQVNGGELSGRTSAIQAALAVDSEQGSSFIASDLSRERISVTTGGLIDSYREIASRRVEDGWEVELRVVVSRLRRSEQVDRLRLAVFPFRGQDAEANAVATAVVPSLIDRLTRARKFAMLDRAFGAEVRSELARIDSQAFDRRERVRLGSLVGADLAVVGRVPLARSMVREIEFESVSRSVRRTINSAVVQLRVVDVATGQIKFSTTWESGPSAAPFEELAGDAARDLATRIVEAIYPIRIEAWEGNRLTLGQGGGTISQGQRMALIALGEELVDGYTGETLGRKERRVGVIEIEAIRPKTADAVIVESSIEPGREFAAGDFIVRSMPSKPSDISESDPSILHGAAERELKERQESLDDVW